MLVFIRLSGRLIGCAFCKASPRFLQFIVYINLSNDIIFCWSLILLSPSIFLPEHYDSRLHRPLTPIHRYFHITCLMSLWMLELDTNAKFMFCRIHAQDQICSHIVSRNQLAQILQYINDISNYTSFIEQFWVISCWIEIAYTLTLYLPGLVVSIGHYGDLWIMTDDSPKIRCFCLRCGSFPHPP